MAAWLTLVQKLTQIIGYIFFSSLLRRIIIVNLAALIFLVSNIMFLHQLRAGLVDAKLESLYTQGQMIVGALSAASFMAGDPPWVASSCLMVLRKNKEFRTAYDKYWRFSINPERATDLLRRIIMPKRAFARLFDAQGELKLDSRFLYMSGQKVPYSADDYASIYQNPPHLLKDFYNKLWRFFAQQNSPIYDYPYASDRAPLPPLILERIKNGAQSAVINFWNPAGGQDIGVALPLLRENHLVGVLVVATVNSDIENIIFEERLAIFRMALLVAIVLIFLSAFLSYTIANPLRRLAEAANEARRRLNKRVVLPDFSKRQDEIGHLSSSIRGLTEAFYKRLEAIERFAADVSHELKNPLTSLRSAVETFPLAKDDRQKQQLYEVIKHDISRLDRLITDISAASRVDGELSREDSEIIDMAKLLNNYIDAFRQTFTGKQKLDLSLVIDENIKQGYLVYGNDLRFGQVIANLLANAQSFIPQDNGQIEVKLYRNAKSIMIDVKDNGPGIGVDDIEKIFERFYTDRPDSESFGQNSGLGLSISRQIIENYGGRLKAANIWDKSGQNKLGACFTIELPAADNSALS